MKLENQIYHLTGTKYYSRKSNILFDYNNVGDEMTLNIIIKKSNILFFPLGKKTRRRACW